MALAMFSTAMRRNPAATCSGAGSSPVAAPISAPRAAKPRSTAASSSGASAPGPKTLGKKAGTIRPSMRFASVTVSGPPRR